MSYKNLQSDENPDDTDKANSNSIKNTSSYASGHQPSIINVRASLLNRRRLNSNAKILMMGIDQTIARDSGHTTPAVKRPT